MNLQWKISNVLYKVYAYLRIILKFMKNVEFDQNLLF